MNDRVGIPGAIDSSGRTFGRAAIDEEPQPFDRPLRCGDCTTPVNPVRGYPRRPSSIWVASHYRLTSRESAPHDEGCRYDFDAQIGRLYDEHRRALVRNGDTFELRLPRGDPAPDRSESEVPVRTHRRTRLTVRPRPGRHLEPTISAATAIARLLATYENDPAAQSRFTAGWRGDHIPWEEFYFDTARDARRLARTVEQHAHPVAVSGVIKDSGSTTSGSSYSIELDTNGGVRHAPTGRWIHVWIYSTDPDLLDFHVGQRVLGYGQWQSWIPDYSANNYFVRLWLDQRSAMTRIEPVRQTERAAGR